MDYLIRISMGMAIFWALTIARGRPFTVRGLGGILIMLFISYGLGTIVHMLLQR